MSSSHSHTNKQMFYNQTKIIETIMWITAFIQIQSPKKKTPWETQNVGGQVLRKQTPSKLFFMFQSIFLPSKLHLSKNCAVLSKQQVLHASLYIWKLRTSFLSGFSLPIKPFLQFSKSESDILTLLTITTCDVTQERKFYIFRDERAGCTTE